MDQVNAEDQKGWLPVVVVGDCPALASGQDSLFHEDGSRSQGQGIFHDATRPSIPSNPSLLTGSSRSIS